MSGSKTNTTSYSKAIFLSPNSFCDLDKIKCKLVIMDHSGPLKKNYLSGNQRALFRQGGTTQMERLICFPPWGLGKEEMAQNEPKVVGEAKKEEVPKDSLCFSLSSG